jgi:hypothetical protein
MQLDIKRVNVIIQNEKQSKERKKSEIKKPRKNEKHELNPLVKRPIIPHF